MHKKAQGGVEYLLVIGLVTLVAAIVITSITKNIGEGKAVAAASTADVNSSLQTLRGSGEQQGTLSLSPPRIEPGKVTLSWEYQKNADAYRIYKSGDGNTFTLAATTADLNYTDTNTAELYLAYYRIAPVQGETEYPYLEIKVDFVKYALGVFASGNGFVRQTFGTTSCDSNCPSMRDANSIITLTAIPGTNYEFSGWSGECFGTGPNCTIKADANKTLSAQFSAIPAQITLYATAAPTIIANDINYTHQLIGAIPYACTVLSSATQNTAVTTPTFTAQTPAIATIDPDGNVTYIKDGNAVFEITSGLQKRAVSCVMRSNASDKRAFNRFTPSSLAAEMKQEIDSRINGLTPTPTTYNIYSSANDTTNTYTRNPTLWAQGIDLTSFPAWGSTVGTLVLGVLVAPDTMITCWHSCNDGTRIFVTNNNTSISRQVTNRKSIPGSDICVVKLDSDLPPEITPAKVFSKGTFEGTYSQFKTTKAALTSANIPVAVNNQFRTLRLRTMKQINSYFMNVDYNTSPLFAYGPWEYLAVGGDSGSPVYAFVNGQAVALGVWTDSSDFPPISEHVPEINTTMQEMGSPYTLTTIDLNGFPTYTS